jgi:hypothetical protein
MIAIGSRLNCGFGLGVFVCIVIAPTGIVAMCARASLCMRATFSGFRVTNPRDLGVLPVRLSVCALVSALFSPELGA